MLASLVERLADAGGVGSVYGEPVEHGDRTVVPVARAGWGFGAGGGTSEAETEAGEEEETEAFSENFGLGGGVSATPVGALEITDEGTRFVRFEERKKLLALGAIAFVAGWLAGR